MTSEFSRRMILAGTAAVAMSSLVQPPFAIASPALLPPPPAPWPVNLGCLFGEYLSSIFRVGVRNNCLVWFCEPRGDDFLGPNGFRISKPLREEMVDYLMFGNDVIYFVEEAEPAPGLVEKRVTRVIPWKKPTPESFAAAYLQGLVDN